MKVDIVAKTRDEGFGLTIVVSVTHAVDGTPLDGLDASNFDVAVIQSPSGWAVGDTLKISSGLFEPAPGVYAFAVETSGGSKVPAGGYTLAIITQGYKGWAQVHGQTLATASVK